MTALNTATQAKRKLRTAVVGCGVIGRQHAQVITNNKDLELIALVDPIETAAASLADSSAGSSAHVSAAICAVS